MAEELGPRPLTVGPSKRLVIIRVSTPFGQSYDPRLIAQWAAREWLIPAVYRVIESTSRPLEDMPFGEPLKEQWVKVASPDLDEVPDGGFIPCVKLTRVHPNETYIPS